MRFGVQLLLLVAAGVAMVAAVDRNNFKKCDESSFCVRNRAVKGPSSFLVDSASLTRDAATASLDLHNPSTNQQLLLTLAAVGKGMIRVRVTEKVPVRPRYEVKDVLPEPLQLGVLNLEKQDNTTVVFTFGESKAIVSCFPFRIDVLRGSEPIVSINSRGLLNYESFASRPENVEGGAWDETYKTHADSKPNGPQSVGVDFSFPGVEHVYGIPEHATSLALKPTAGGDPYRLYNLDVFEYEINNPMALYGSIPFMVAHREKQTSGVFVLNASEMWIDVALEKLSDTLRGFLSGLSSFFGGSSGADVQTDTHWFAESGILDIFVLTGPTVADVYSQYAYLTGKPSLPPLFAIAYHQSRWNYNDQDDVAFVDQKYDDSDIPLDVIWLDIEHTDGKRYMTWDSGKFPNPEEMQNKLAVKQRKMVTIVDPHIKRAGGYHIHDEASRLGYYIKNKDNNDYEGHCWPGGSSWLDFLNPTIRSWWSDQFAYDKYKGSTASLYVWNDMNEPSVFNGPEVTMHKDAKHYGGWEHRDVHNIYGMWLHAATADGIVRRSGGVERPFVLSRAFFAGTQKYGAIWTGDNTAAWSHLEASLPMLLSLNAAGLPFVGADMGGFFGNPDSELLVRWYQAGAYQPFMRAHAHLDTRRREPYLLEEKDQQVVRDAVRQRYILLPYWYSVFQEASETGMPVMRPMWMEFPNDKATYSMETQHMVGNALLVAPVLKEKTTSVNVYFPDTPDAWYDVENFQIHQGPVTKLIAAPLRKVPVFQRGGTIVPKKMRVRRTSGLTHNDPFTLVAALGAKGTAKGSLYVDDYHTVDSDSIKIDYELIRSGNDYVIYSKQHAQRGSLKTREWIERIVILGLPEGPSAVRAGDNKSLDFKYDQEKRVLEIKKPGFNVAENFRIVIVM